MTFILALAVGALARHVAGYAGRVWTSHKLGKPGEVRSVVLSKMDYDGLLNLRDALLVEINHRREPAQ